MPEYGCAIVIALIGVASFVACLLLRMKGRPLPDFLFGTRHIQAVNASSLLPHQRASQSLQTHNARRAFPRVPHNAVITSERTVEPLPSVPSSEVVVSVAPMS